MFFLSQSSSPCQEGKTYGIYTFNIEQFPRNANNLALYRPSILKMFFHIVGTKQMYVS